MSPIVSNMEELQRKVQKLLEREGIKTVAMIDDAYQPPRRVDIFEKLDHLIQKLEEDSREQELARLCELPKVAGFDSNAFNDAHVQYMWEQCLGARDDDIIHELLTEVFRQHLDYWEPVEFIRSTLESLGLTVRALLPQDDAFKVDADMWMLDLFWEPIAAATAEMSPAWNQTARFAQQQFKREQPPFFVLMSSHHQPLEYRREEFRRAAMLPAGSFDIWHKRTGDSESDTPALLRWLAGVLEAAPFRKRIFQLVQAVENAAEEALKEYKASLHALAPEDYAHIYRYSLEEEGHPLGDYVLWLLEPLFEYHLRQHTRVRELRADLDRLSSSELPFYDCLERPPSTALREIHQLRIWQQIDKPLESTQEHGIPRIHQGDLLVDVTDDTCVFLVLNADCDLAFSEAGGPRAEPKKELSVLLLPGVVEPFGIETKTDGQTVFTDFYNDAQGGDPQAHRIRWRLGLVATRKYEDISPKSYKRRWRLRRPFLSKLVQRWSHYVTREGAPVSPPVIEKLQISKVLWRAPKSKEWQEHPIKDGTHEGYLFSRFDDTGKKSNKLVIRDRDQLLAALHELALDNPSNVLSVVASALQANRDLEIPDESKRVKCGQKALLCLYDVPFEKVSEKVQLILLFETPERAL